MRQRLAGELLDEDAGTPAEIQSSLDELWWINRHLGGCASWNRLLREVGGVGTLLDVGCGRGEMARWLGVQLGASVVMLDRRASHLGREGRRVAGDAWRLPFAAHSFDVVTCTLFLHHFHDQAGRPEATQLLREMRRVARRAVLINDLERGWIPWLVISALGRGFSRLTRHDGPRSVRQAYTAAELERLGAPWRHRVLRLTHYRLGLIVWSEG